MKISAAYTTPFLQSIVNDLAGGKVCYYTDPMPADPSVAVTTQTNLADLGLGTPAGTVSGLTITFASITEDISANASGVATWARCYKSDGTTAVLDLTVGIGQDLDGDGNLVAGQSVIIDALIVTFN